jgi:hypothetical protein
VPLQPISDLMKLSGEIKPRLFQHRIICPASAFFALSRLCATFF